MRWISAGTGHSGAVQAVSSFGLDYHTSMAARREGRGRVDTEVALPVCQCPGKPNITGRFNEMAARHTPAHGWSWSGQASEWEVVGRFPARYCRDQMIDGCPCHAHSPEIQGSRLYGMHAVGGMAVISSRRAKLQPDKPLGPDLTPAGPPQAYCIIEPSGPKTGWRCGQGATRLPGRVAQG